MTAARAAVPVFQILLPAEFHKIFTLMTEYFVRMDQMAVYGKFANSKEAHPLYDTAHNLKYLSSVPVDGESKAQ